MTSASAYRRPWFFPPRVADHDDDVGVGLRIDGLCAGFCFGADGPDARIGLGVDGLRLAGAGGLLHLRLRGEFGDGDAALGINDAGLRVGHGAGLLQILARLFGQLLRLVGDLLLLGDLAVSERLHQRFRRRDVTDQRVDGVHVVLGREPRAIATFASAWRSLRFFRNSITSEVCAALRK